MLINGLRWVILLGVCGSLLGQDEKPTYKSHLDMSYYLNDSGERVPILTQQDWSRRRTHILNGMMQMMGPVPQPAPPVPLEMEIHETVQLDGFSRQLISYHTDSMARRVRAYLFIPDSAGRKQKTAAILCLHQTTAIGKEEPAGLGGKPELHYALHLAKRGYVTLAPDYPSFGDYAYDFPAADGYQSGSMKAIYDNIRAVDLLAQHEAVDRDRIGCIGHSLGGHNTIFTAAFDNRIQVIVSNCGFTRFHKYYDGKLKGWTSKRYMPLIDSRCNNDPDRVTFDFPEIIASLAPRPFLASAPTGDSNFEVSGVRDTIRIAKPVYERFQAGDALQSNYPDAAHSFPPEAREVAYDFFDKWLRQE